MDEKEFKNRTELRSVEVQEVMGNIPSWILRWGNTLLLGIVLGLLIASFYIKYPDVYEGRVCVYSIPKPLPVCSELNGIIAEWKVENGMNIKQDNVLCIIHGDSSDRALIAPISGVVDLHEHYYVGMDIALNEIICNIIPDSVTRYIGRMTVPSNMKNKIKKGKSVLVCLDGFSYQDYGCLNGKIESVSQLLNLDGNYYVEIDFPNGMITNRNIKLSNIRSLNGDAKIIIQEKKLIERILLPVYNLMNKVFPKKMYNSNK